MREPLTYAVAHTAAQAVIAAGRERGLHVAVSVVNRSGITKVILADDGAGVIAVETSRRKAYTTAVTGMPSAMFAQVASDPRMAAAPPHVLDPQLLPAPGAVPIVVECEVIGAVGVGGADGETDVSLAEAGLASVASLL